MADRQIFDAKVAKVLSAHEIAINAGADKQVTEGSFVTVIDIVEINDPDTGDKLGSVRQNRLRLTIRVVGDRFAVARVIEPGSPGASGRPTLKRIVSGVDAMSGSPFGGSPSGVPVTVGDLCTVEIKPTSDDIPF